MPIAAEPTLAMTQDDPEIRRELKHQINLRGARAAACTAEMVKEHRYRSNLTYAMWVKILAKIEEVQAGHPKGGDVQE
jgi:hypothetical protein